MDAVLAARVRCDGGGMASAASAGWPGIGGRIGGVDEEEK